MNIVKVQVSMPAVRVFSGSALTFYFGLAGRYCTFDGSVAIGKPEWHVCKASHCGSKQQ